MLCFAKFETTAGCWFKTVLYSSRIWIPKFGAALTYATESAMAERISRKEKALKTLAGYFQRNGCIRWVDPEMKEKLGYKKYKKGYEVRLVAQNEKELAALEKALKAAGFKHGKPYPKNKQTIIPIYGKEQVERFIDEVETFAV
jgi:hypothetical protein